MKRRSFFKVLAGLAALPVIAPLAKLLESKPKGFSWYGPWKGKSGLTKNDDLFGSDACYLSGNRQDELAVKQGVEDHLRSGLSVYSPEIAKVAVQRDIDESAGDFYSARTRSANWWLESREKQS